MKLGEKNKEQAYKKGHKNLYGSIFSLRPRAKTEE